MSSPYDDPPDSPWESGVSRGRGSGHTVIALSQRWAGRLDEDFARDVALARTVTVSDEDVWSDA